MKIRILGIFVFVVMTSCLQNFTEPTIRFPYLWLDEPGFGGDIDKQGIIEPSGICYHPLRKTLFVVSDEGEIAEITTEGDPVFNQKIPGDLEGVTVDPQTGLLYIIQEGEDVILEFDPEKKEVTRKFPINREFEGNPEFIEKQTDSFDNGIEDIVFIQDINHPEGGTFYVSNQLDPSCIIELYVPLKTSQKPLSDAKIIRVLPFKMADPAAMYYDPKTRLLNVVSDFDNILVELTLDGKLVNQYAFLGDNQEGLARDDKGFLYIAQDSGGILKVKDLR